MYKAEDPTLRRVIQIYYRVGVWRSEGESDFRKSCIQMLNFLQFFSFVVFISKCGYDAYLSKDMDQVVYLCGILLCIAIILVKLCYLIWRKKEILKFLYDPAVTHCTANYDESVTVKHKLNKFIMFIKFYTILGINALFLVIFIPLLTLSNGEKFTNRKMLPLLIRVNVESNWDLVLYWMSYVYASVNCVLSVIYVFVSIFIWYTLLNYSIEYNLLGHRFRSLGTTKSNTYQQEFLHSVRAHNHLFATIERFRSCFAIYFLAEITTGAISICVSIYNLSFNNSVNVFQMGIYVIFLLYSTFEIFLIMYLANEITLESDRISYCLFESNWMDQSESIKKYVIILGEMIKEPQRLVIFIYPMNLEKFTSIVNGAYSMFNLLKSFK